ncbi:MAG: AraC family transcriptional regulator [Bdellovibrionales bacterium]|nr:AraC family transcriptional regulator [Ramlibacter sp.]
MPTRAHAGPKTTPTAATPMAFARAMVAAYHRYGESPAQALKLAQITPTQLQQVNGRMTARQMETLSGAAMRELDDEGLGAFARRLPWGSYGMLARASLSAPNLGVALKRWCRHHGLIAPDVQLKLGVTGDAAVISVDETNSSLGAAQELSLCFMLRNIHGLACWYIDSRIPLQETRLPYPAPAHSDTYRHIFPGPLLFDAPRAEIRFDARYLSLPLRRDEKALQQMLQHALPVTVLQYRRDRLLVRQVRQVLSAHAADGHSAEGVAKLLHVSVRTLHRHLKEEGASLQQLKDEMRCERARDLLQRTSRPVKQVAAAAGFRNEKSFIRAFQTWTGQTPALFRSQAGV